MHFELWIMLNGKRTDYNSIFEVRLKILSFKSVSGTNTLHQAHSERFVYDADTVLWWRQQWMSQWATDVLRACNNFNQKFTRQSFYSIVLLRFLGLSRSGVKILHNTTGGISLRTLDNHASQERKTYIDDAHNMMNNGICTWYADNYTHRYVRRALAYGEPGYHNMDTTVVAMATCDIKRDRLRLSPGDLAVDPDALKNPMFTDSLVKDCVEAVKNLNGKETLVRRYQVSNWPPKPDANNLPQPLRGMYLVNEHVND